MRVKNLVPWAGLTFSYLPGDIVELPDAVAKGRAALDLVEIVAQDTPLTGAKPKKAAAPPPAAPEPAAKPAAPVVDIAAAKSKKTAK